MSPGVLADSFYKCNLYCVFAEAVNREKGFQPAADFFKTMVFPEKEKTGLFRNRSS